MELVISLMLTISLSLQVFKKGKKLAVILEAASVLTILFVLMNFLAIKGIVIIFVFYALVMAMEKDNSFKSKSGKEKQISYIYFLGSSVLCSIVVLNDTDPILKINSSNFIVLETALSLVLFFIFFIFQGRSKNAD